MIKLESILIEEFRGIRKLELTFGGRNFAVLGRNGTGKSGVVDAIEFALTGSISRLSGEGTDKLSVKKHAPHVDSRSNPENARVTLRASIPSLKKTVELVRSPNDPSHPVVTPSDPDVLAVLKQVEDHPELVLTRREIIRYVLATEGKRSEEVQAVLKLDRVDHIRGTLRTISNAQQREEKSALQLVSSASDVLTQALGIPQLSKESLLAEVNIRRQVLGVPTIPVLTPTTSLKDGIATQAKTAIVKVVKTIALKDLAECRTQIARLQAHETDSEFERAREACEPLTRDPSQLADLSRETFLRTGLGFVSDPHCPFCDRDWDIASLREHVDQKLKELDKVRTLRTEAEKAIEPVEELIRKMVTTIGAVVRHGVALGVPLPELQTFEASLERMSRTLRDFLPLSDTVIALTSPPIPSVEALAAVDDVERRVKGLPDPSKEDEAREYLIICQERLDRYREACQKREETGRKARLSKQVADTYAKTSDDQLTGIYKAVEQDFAEMYSALNTPDEADFEAKLTPSIGKLGFGVNFYGRGVFPPGAYHSEGHQDAMGLCLYLALMKHVLKENFLFAVLDDVLMSIDAGHRRAVCTLLRTRFSETQFILTTHDRVWLAHMQAENLVTKKSSVQFRSWNIDVGPASWDEIDIWTDIEKELEKDRVSVAAELLRNYLEYISAELCDRLIAQVDFRLDDRNQLGDLLPQAFGRLKKLYSKGKDAANSWNLKDMRKELAERYSHAVDVYERTQTDQWQTNAAIHYNSWASLLKEDFDPLVASFKALLDAFRCPKCQSFLRVLRDGMSDKAVTCNCGQAGFNLLNKS